MRRLRGSPVRLEIGALIALLAIVVVASPQLHASAHAALDRSNPEADSTVAAAPHELELFFTQEIDDSGTEIRVLAADGSRVDNDDTTLDLFDPDRKRVTVTLKDGLSAGVYTVEWTSLSAEDGEEDSGSFSFTVAGSASPVASPVASPQASPAASPTKEAGA